MSDFDQGLPRLSGRIGAYTAQSRPDAREATAAARRAFDERFYRQVDPDGILAPAERAPRAEAARKADFVKLAYRSAIARKATARTRLAATKANQGAETTEVSGSEHRGGPRW